jgi:hypothetical protein
MKAIASAMMADLPSTDVPADAAPFCVVHGICRTATLIAAAGWPTFTPAAMESARFDGAAWPQAIRADRVAWNRRREEMK